jgi:uncharacterized membrane protein YphA (DoxX/SURF4 family)
MAIESTAGGAALLAGRLLFGGVLAFMGLNHFRNVDGMAGYAASKGVPAARLGVIASGLLLVLGGLSLVLGAFPLVGAAAIAAFLVVTTHSMHDFWNVSDPEARQSEMTDFLKNVALVGGALVLFAVGAQAWPYAVGLGV